MRVLLLHPEDNFSGPWKDEHWGWIVDLGRAPKSFYEERSAEFCCPVSSIYDFAVEIEDVQAWRDLFAVGMGRVVDRLGVDWWDVVGLLLQPEMQDIRLATRLAEKVGRGCTLTASRPSLLASAVQLHLGAPLRVLQSGVDARVRNRVARYRTALRNLSFGQLRQVVHDKFDPHYRWRRNFAAAAAPSSQPVVLLPTAYLNVSKTALNYARLLPDQQFLLVVARESAAVAQLPANVQSVSLAAFAANRSNREELRELEDGWMRLERILGEQSEFSLAVRLGVVKQALEFLRRCFSVRDAWNHVFERFSVVGCLSADDSNPYTRIPLILAARREIPAVACHHGALDFRMAFKVPEFSTYLAQGEMERDYLEQICGVDARRICVGAASVRARDSAKWSEDAPWIVFFTEPYESDQWRADAIYREVLPRLCAAARQSGKTVVLKLHPFETAAQRHRLVNAALNEEDRKLVKVVSGPTSPELIKNTWCAVTVESTVACDCASAGIPVFLCGWLRHAYSGYALQYARFGAGRILKSAADLARIPEMIPEAIPPTDVAMRLAQPISQDTLAEVLLQPAVEHLAKTATGD
ncbi:MAG: hypothetical protein WCC32_09960 [Terriglobales bacterium]